jgi:hypothetical protein
VVQAVDFVSDEPEYAGTVTMTWEVATAESGTRIGIRAKNVPDGISADDHADGFTSLLANLAAYLERYRSTAGMPPACTKIGFVVTAGAPSANGPPSSQGDRLARRRRLHCSVCCLAGNAIPAGQADLRVTTAAAVGRTAWPAMAGP